jgi:hypothetical protein
MPSSFSGSDAPIIGLLLVLALCPLASRAEGIDNPSPVRLAAWAGFQFTSDVSTAGGTVSINGAPSYGGAVALAVDPEFELEALWTISSTNAHFVSYTGTVPNTLPNKLVVNYFQLGITKTNRFGSVDVFGEMTAGLVLLSPNKVFVATGESLSVSDTWNFAFTLAAGVRFFFIEQLALVLEARLLAPLYITSGGFFSGPGGTVLVVGAGIPCVQGAFSAGLAVEL